MLADELDRWDTEAPRSVVDFGSFVRAAARDGATVVQPRMGFSDPAQMRAGLTATRAAAGTTAGTITLDSYTRVGDLAAAEQALSAGIPLNGYPIVNHDTAVTRGILDGLHSGSFAVQVRHGSAAPKDILRSLLASGLNATEGGPVSYCLPYGRTPLADSVRNWRECCELLACSQQGEIRPHLETFGGCLLGQLCPPSLLVAVTVLEALFFRQHGVRSISVSYAQQPDPAQDREAISALRWLCGELLSDVDWHVVLYTYMGLYPATTRGAYAVLGEAAELAAATGTERLIVKTVAETTRIPTIEENVAALEHAAEVAARSPRHAVDGGDNEVLAEATRLVGAVLELGDDVGAALCRAFAYGYLDVPYCVHPDNQGRTRSYIDDGRLRWADTGAMPLGAAAVRGADGGIGSADLLDALSYVQRKFDGTGNNGVDHDRYGTGTGHAAI